MTLTATTFPGLDPLLQSGVIAVFPLTRAVRLGRAGREAVPCLGGRSRLHPRRARAAAVPATGPLGRGVARERRGLDPRRRGRGERGRGARQCRPAGRGLGGGADGARAVVRRARGGGPAPPGQDAVTRVVTFGELLLRLSPPGEERLFESSDLVTCFGGAEANVAVALSHFGVRCDYVTRIPDNPIGHAGVAALEREGVGTEWIQRGGERLGIYFVEPGADLRAMRVVYDRAGSALARIEPHAVDWPRVLAGADWFHASGITPALGDGPAAVLADAIARARAQRIPVSFDLNYREALWRAPDPRPPVEAPARQAPLPSANPTAVRAMLGIDADESSLATPDLAREVAQGLAHRCGGKRVALTRREILRGPRHGWSAVLYEI